MKIAPPHPLPFLARALLLAAALGVGQVATHGQTLYGPTPYVKDADSPFLGTVCIEDFEDHLFNQPGVTCDNGGVASVDFGANGHDSVDADDGVIDGSGLQGDDWWSFNSPVTFTFDAGILGALPTRVGVVWTDGVGYTTFEAFDGNGQSLGVIGPVLIADGSYNGTTADDHFFGIEYAGGIGSITIGSGGAQEVDHLQFSCSPIPASETVRLGTPPNPDALRPGLTSGPVLREVWNPWVDHTTFHPAATLDILAISTGSFESAFAFGTLLIDPSLDVFYQTVPAGSPFAVPVPDSHVFVGVQAFTQAASLPQLELTNALDLVLGIH